MSFTFKSLNHTFSFNITASRREREKKTVNLVLFETLVPYNEYEKKIKINWMPLHLYAKLPRQPAETELPADRHASNQVANLLVSCMLHLPRVARSRKAGEWHLLLSLSTGAHEWPGSMSTSARTHSGEHHLHQKTAAKAHLAGRPNFHISGEKTCLLSTLPTFDQLN